MQPVNFNNALFKLNEATPKGKIRYLTYNVSLGKTKEAWCVEEVAVSKFKEGELGSLYIGFKTLNAEERAQLQKYLQTSSPLTQVYQRILENDEEEGEFSQDISTQLVDDGKIDASSTFSDTDMVVYADGSKNLPFEGITQSELAQIENLYNQIKDGQTKFKIDDQPPGYKNLILESIKKLLTRPTGRQLINTLQNRRGLKEIAFVCDERNSAKGFKKVKILLGRGEFFVLDHRSDKRQPIGGREQPFFMALGHELLHCLRGKTLFNKPHIHDYYHTAEEERDIVGFSRNFSEYTKLNERTLALEFNLSPRAGHIGFYFPSKPDHRDIRAYCRFVLENELWSECAKDGGKRGALIRKTTLDFVNEIVIYSKKSPGAVNAIEIYKMKYKLYELLGLEEGITSLEYAINMWKMNNTKENREQIAFIMAFRPDLLEKNTKDGVSMKVVLRNFLK